MWLLAVLPFLAMGSYPAAGLIQKWQGSSPGLMLLASLYVIVELWRYRRFKQLLRRLQPRSYAHNGGEHFLNFVIHLFKAKKAPLSLDATCFQRYAAGNDLQSVGYGGGPLTWHRLYAWWAWGCGRPFDAPRDPKLHAQLLEGASLSCKALGIPGPPLDTVAKPVKGILPFGFGCCEIRATFKPLPVRAFLRAILIMTRLVLQILGFRRIVQPIPGGELVGWTDVPADGGSSDRPPVVFLHGLGLGIFTYFPLFIGKNSQAWRRGGSIIIELPNMTHASDQLVSRPEVMHYADGLAQLLRAQFDRGEFEYDIVCHSLSSYLVAALCNQGSPCRPRRSVLIDPVCFIEGVEVCGRFPFRNAEECREFAESTVLFPKCLPLFARHILGWVFRRMVCQDIFTQYSVLRWNGTNATNILWHATDTEALVCLSDDDNFVPSERVAGHCAAHFPLIKQFRMPGKDHGSFVIEAKVRGELLKRISDYFDKSPTESEAAKDFPDMCYGG